jgi:hypothetical protein
MILLYLVVIYLSILVWIKEYSPDHLTVSPTGLTIIQCGCFPSCMLFVREDIITNMNVIIEKDEGIRGIGLFDGLILYVDTYKNDSYGAELFSKENEVIAKIGIKTKTLKFY